MRSYSSPKSHTLMIQPNCLSQVCRNKQFCKQDMCVFFFSWADPVRNSCRNTVRWRSPELVSPCCHILVVPTTKRKWLCCWSAVILCGMQNIPLRSHRRDATHVQLDTAETHRKTRFCVSGIYLVTQNNNALYASKITENEITVSVGEQKIKSEMR